jgi:23S rRNA (uracil1939-C5)-methyltransferase
MNSKNIKNSNKRDINKKQGIHSLCPVSGVCGGCQYIDMDYKEQLKKKQKYISGLLQPYGHVNEIIGMENPYNYRNKVCATFRRKRNGDIISGKYEEGTHRVIDTKRCLIEDKRADEIIQTITRLIKSFKITVYNEDSGYGLMRHVLIRTGYATGQLMVILVTASPVFPSRKNFSKALLKAHPDITTIVQNINDRDTSMVLGERNQVIYGRGYIEDILCGKHFRISPNSFYQVNPVQTEKLYNKAIEYAKLNKNQTVIDAYCGIGTIGIVASSHAKNVIGVELNNAAIKDARINSRMNNTGNISFYNNDAGRFMVGMAEGGEPVDVVFMDPPRSGSDEAFLSSVVKLSPGRVVYISCGPETLARDLKYLTKHGYKFVEATPVDLFPFTEHVECIVCIQRIK